MHEKEIRKKARSEVGVLLPNTDPTIGELVLTTLYGNPTATMAQVIGGLVMQAPAPEVAIEIIQAGMELLLCKSQGDLILLQDAGQSILAGARRALVNDAMVIGDAEWPYKALMQGPPIRHIVRMPDGVREVYMAGDLKGAIIRQSEAVAIGNAAVERLGGRIVEDRSGPNVMRQSFIEANMTTRTKLRAQAEQAMQRMTTRSQHKDREFRSVRHQRQALAEAFPGTVEILTRLVQHEDPSRTVFIVERRINESWVIIVSEDENAKSIEPGSWVREDGRPPIDMEGVDPFVGFTDYATRSSHADERGEDPPDGDATEGVPDQGAEDGGGGA